MGLLLLSGMMACQNQSSETATLQGKWRLDSVALGESQDTLGRALLALTMARSGADHYAFTSDGQFKVFDAHDSVLSVRRYEVVGADQQLIIKQGAGATQSIDTFGQIVSQTPEKLKIKQKAEFYLLKRLE